MKKILQAGPSITDLEKSYVKKMMDTGWSKFFINLSEKLSKVKQC